MSDVSLPVDLGPRYVPVRELGSGGAGRVVLVRDGHRDEEVALKLLHAAPQRAGEVERLEREFTFLSRVEHPAIARAHEFGYAGGERYGEAIRAYHEAERACRDLDRGPSLVSIHCNRAVLQAKRGEFELVERALAEAEALSPGALGRRQDVFLHHARGRCALYRGRYRDAQPELERAAGLGAEMGAPTSPPSIGSTAARRSSSRPATPMRRGLSRRESRARRARPCGRSRSPVSPCSRR